MTGVCHFDGEHHERVGYPSKRPTERITATDIDAVRTEPLGCGNCITQVASADPARH
jgi:hypothetical protein